MMVVISFQTLMTYDCSSKSKHCSWMLQWPGLAVIFTALCRSRRLAIFPFFSSTGRLMTWRQATTTHECSFQHARQQTLCRQTVTLSCINWRSWCGASSGHTRPKLITLFHIWNSARKNSIDCWGSLLNRAGVMPYGMRCSKRWHVSGFKARRTSGIDGCRSTCRVKHPSTWVECFQLLDLTLGHLEFYQASRLMCFVYSLSDLCADPFTCESK